MGAIQHMIVDKETSLFYLLQHTQSSEHLFWVYLGSGIYTLGLSFANTIFEHHYFFHTSGLNV